MADKARLKARLVLAGHSMVLILAAAWALLPWHRFYASSISLSGMLAQASAEHPLGTDGLGRDVLVRLHEALLGSVLPLWGLVILGHALALLVAGLLSAAAATPLRRLSSGLESLAGLLISAPLGLAVFLLAVLWEEASARGVLLGVGTYCAVKTWLMVSEFYRIDSQRAYWLAHQSLGGSLTRRFWDYGVRDQWRRPLAASLSQHLEAALVVETSLSYLGFGVQEPQASLGNMLASHYDLFLGGHATLFWQIAAVLALVLLVPTSFGYLLTLSQGRQTTPKSQGQDLWTAERRLWVHR